MDDIMFGEENQRYIKSKKKKQVKKSNHKHTYVWAIGETYSEKHPEILIRYCSKCGKVDNYRVPFFNEKISSFKEYEEAKDKRVPIINSGNNLFFDLKYI